MRRILPKIMVAITRKDRYLPEIMWSKKSWTHNFFRMYELIFWRRHGIRPEMSAQLFEEDGEMFAEYRFFSVEAFIAHSESLVRAYLLKKKLKIRAFKVHFRRILGLDYVPIMATSFGTLREPMPFISFVIALDVETDAVSTSSGTTASLNHTCSGSNLILFTAAVGNNTGSATDDITGATYNAVSSTQIDKVFVAADRYRYLFYLIAPATGTNSTVITSSTSGGFKGIATISYTGVKQSGQPDSHNTNSATSTTLVTSTTVVASNCWIILVGGVGGASPSAGTGSTMRGTKQVVTWFDSNGTVSTGSNSMTINTDDSGTHPIMACMASFAPSVASTGNYNFLSFMSPQ